MKRVSRLGRSAPALKLTEPPRAVSRDALTLVSDLRVRGTHIASGCLRCLDEPCTNFSPVETSLGRALPVCPVPGGAIRLARAPSGPTVTEACLGCGVCAFRCPVGAISLAGPTAAVTPPNLGEFYEPALDESDFLRSRSGIGGGEEWLDSDIAVLVQRVVATSAEMTQASFYPLVQSLFVAAGFPALRPNQGDTSNRVDLILIDEARSLPVEIKSPTESPAISIKSVQQALENWVVMRARVGFSIGQECSSLVVGFKYPAERSGVIDLVRYIFEAFGVKIGLISLEALATLAITACLRGAAHSRDVLVQLKGSL